MSADVERNALAAFLSALAERAYKENDLSDVTYALFGGEQGVPAVLLGLLLPKRRACRRSGRD